MTEPRQMRDRSPGKGGDKARPGRSYAKGGPASMRKKKTLRQTRLGIGNTTAQKVRNRQSSDITSISSKGSLQAIQTLENTTDQTNVCNQDSYEDEGRIQMAFRQVSSSGSESEKQMKSAGQISTPIRTQSRNLRTKKPAKRLQQSRINLTPGVSRFISTDPLDSEDEEFRATQMAPKTTFPRHVSPELKEPVAHASPTLTPSDGKLEDRIATSAKDVSKRTPIRKVISISDDDEDDEDELITPMKRRKRFMPSEPERSAEAPGRRRRRTDIMTARDDPPEARDLDRKLIRTSKKRQGNSQKNAYRSGLERLRRKKAGLESESEQDIGDKSDSFGEAVESGPEDWIVDDEIDRGQILDALPAEFQQPRQPLEQFKIAVQWEILDLLMPQGGLEPDRYFKPAIEWLRDRTAGKSQAAISSIWRRHFVRALQRGPDLNAAETGNLGYFCDACGRTNRVATFVVKFEGSRYDRLTLEDLGSDADSSEDDLDVDENAASDAEEEKARKERIMRAEWNLGVNCYERTCVAHELYHLRKHLREELHDRLHDMGLFTASKIYRRSTLSRSKRIEFANQVTEELEGARFQQRLWTRYKAAIEKNENYIVDPNAGKRKSRFLA